MTNYIVLLKGINVGGHKKVPMAELRELLTKSGFEDVKTYIQSGNVVLKSSKKNTKTIEEMVQKAMATHFGFQVSVLVKTHQALRQIFDNSPFPEAKKEKSYFVMLHDTPPDDLVKMASEKIYEGEAYYIINDCIYFYSENGYGNAKFSMNYFERKLKTIGTARNYNTMVKLLSLSDNMS